MNGRAQSPAVIQLWASPGNMPKPAKPPGEDDLRQWEALEVGGT